MNGQQMALELSEQPARLRELIARAPEIGGQLRELIPQPLHGVTIVARGSSDCAAVYGRYLIEAATGKPVSLAAPSLHTHYQIPADYRGQLVIAISQSGATPEIVRTLARLQEAGARGLGITNEADSDLARMADMTIALEMGRELAVPATKTVTAQLVAMAIVAAALAAAAAAESSDGHAAAESSGGGGAALSGVPGWIEQVLADPAPAVRVAAALAGSSQLVVAARGYLYAAALESALKIKETSYLVAEGYSVADLRHGPIAAVTSGVPVVAMTSAGVTQADVLTLAGDLRARGVPVFLVGPLADADIPLPEGMPEELAPIVATVRGHQLAHRLALALGHDPDTPEGLKKVTVT